MNDELSSVKDGNCVGMIFIVVTLRSTRGDLASLDKGGGSRFAQHGGIETSREQRRYL